MDALRIAICPVFFAGTSSIGASATPQDIAPSTPWELHSGDDSCYLARTFGQGGEQLQLKLSRFYPGPNLDVVVGGSLVISGDGLFAPQFYFERPDASGSPPAAGAYLGMSDGFPTLDFGTRRLDNVGLDKVPQVESHIQPDLTPEQEAAIDHAVIQLPRP